MVCRRSPVLGGRRFATLERTASVMANDLPGVLGPYRVLDLTSRWGFLCGKILGDLGADVVKVEPPGGDPDRGLGPFYQDEPHRERSLYWYAYNTSKRGITLNLAT